MAERRRTTPTVHDCPLCGRHMVERPKPRRRWSDLVSTVVVAVPVFGTIISAISGDFARAGWFIGMAIFAVVTDTPTPISGDSRAARSRVFEVDR